MKDLAEIRRRLADNPGDGLALQAAARYYLSDGAYKQAQAIYLTAFTSQPKILSSILLDFEQEISTRPEKPGSRLALTGFFLSIGDLDAALLELEEMLEDGASRGNNNLGRVEGYNLLGRLYIKLNRIDEAIALLERSISEGIRDVDLTETLAAAYLSRGRVGEAIGFYREILAQKPGDKKTLRILGELYTQLEEYNLAAQTYAAMFSDDPEVAQEVIQRLGNLLKMVEGSIEIRERLAEIYIKALRPDEAVELLCQIIRLESSKLDDVIAKLKGVIKNYPAHPAAVLTLAEALRRKGDYSEAAEQYRQLIRTKPDLQDEIVQGYHEILTACPEQVLARAYLGEALIMQNRLPEALTEFSQMIAADPSVADLVIQKCREVLRLEPQSIKAHVVLGQAYLAKNDFQRAAMEAEGAIALDKGLTEAYLLLGDAYSKLQQNHKAAQALRTALSLSPYNLQVHLQFGRARSAELAGEIEQLKQRLQTDRWKVSIHYDLARLYCAGGQNEEAVRELQQAQKDQVRALPAFNLLGNIYRSEGRYEQAAAHYNRALELPATDLAKTIKANLGTAFEAQGQARKAIKLYEAVLQEDIDFGGLKRRLKLLKATTLASLRNKMLAAVISDFGQKEIIGLWGRETKSNYRTSKQEEVNVSFGQEHNQEGFELFLRGMFPAAEEELLLAVQLDRSFGVALSNLGVTLAKQGKLEEARRRLSEAVQLNPASAVFYNNLGVVQFLAGKVEAAQAALEKSRMLDPELTAACLNLGDLYYFLKDAQKAIEHYQLVGEFDPLTDLAQKRLFSKVP